MAGQREARSPPATEAADYYRLLQNGHDLVYTVDLQGNFTSVNKVVERITGYTQQEALQINLRQLVSEEFQRAVVEMIDRTARGDAGNPQELTLVGKHGQRIFLEVNSLLLFENEKPAAIQGVARDITTRKEAERALQDSEARFRSLFEDAPIAYHEIDREGILRKVNRAECRLLGVEASQILDKPVWNLVAPEQRILSRDSVRRKMTGQEPLSPFKRRYRPHGGNNLVLEIHENLIRDAQGAIVGMRSALLDITEREHAENALHRKSVEMAQARDAALEALADLSCQLRTPLEGAIGMADLLLDMPLTPEQRESARSARQSAETLLAANGEHKGPLDR